MRHRQLRREFSRAATKPYPLRTREQAPARLRTGDLSVPLALVPARPNSPIDAAVGSVVFQGGREGAGSKPERPTGAGEP